MENLFELFHSDISLGEGLIYAVIGYIMVFLMLLLLIIVIQVMAKVIGKTAVKEKAATEITKTATNESNVVEMAAGQNAEAAKPQEVKAPGTGGDLTLINVSDRDAAKIMAIVADTIGKPINELRFRSIREVKENE